MVDEETKNEGIAGIVVLPYEDCRKMEQTHICAICLGELVTASGSAYGQEIGTHIIKCAEDITHHGFVKRGYPAREDQPIYIQNQIEKREAKAMANKYGEEKSTELAQYRNIKALTESQARRVLQMIFGDAPEDERIKAAVVCSQYGLNPLMGQIHLIPFWSNKKKEYEWARVIPIKATRLIAKRQGDYSFIDGPRRMSEEEQREILGAVDKDNIWAFVKICDSKGNVARGYGNYPATGDSPYGMDKGNTRLNMAMIRSERNAFDRLFPMMMPSDIEVIDDTYIESIKGEVIETEAKLVEPEKPKKKPEAKPAPASSSETKSDKPSISSDQIEAIKKITGWDDDRLFLEAINEFDKGLQFGLKDISEISEDDAGEWITKLQSKAGSTSK